MVKLTREEGEGPQITGFAGTGFKVRDVVFPNGIILTQTEAHDWSPPPIAALTASDFRIANGVDALASHPLPEFLLLGTGDALVQPPARFRREIEALGMGIEAMDSRAAARTLAVLRAEERWIVAALYPLG
ncbi:MAG: MTH938/NDUFAF3 family protein [Novosphingopyxis baekryungensis]|jgi:uncharacterized protein|nr:MTH938/NDUFAF3 family protein [Novosphingopyxis baekryungensis]